MEGNLLYELTAHAARMCLPVPVPTAAPDGLIDRLDHWQTLVGAAVGGVVGVGGAMIVARAQRRREQRVAAGLVLPDLHHLITAAEHLEAAHPLPQRSDVDPRPFVGRQQLDNLKSQHVTNAVKSLADRRPALFALHTPGVGQLTDIDSQLYGHLFQCEVAHRRFEESMSDLANGSRPPIPPIFEDWQRCAVHARLAAYLFDRLVFSGWPRWVQRWRMKMWPNDIDRQSRKALRGDDRAATKPRAKRAGSDAVAMAPTEA
jgi:hypothetical protein